MPTALLEIQKAVYAKLTGDATLMSKITGVFDAVPQNQAFPYIVIGDGTEITWDHMGGKRGYEVTMTLHIWSRYNGYAEALGILAELNRLLDRAVLVVAGFATVQCAYEWSMPSRDPDGITRHLPARYRLLVEVA